MCSEFTKRIHGIKIGICFTTALNGFVIDISKVHDMLDVVAECADDTSQGIGCDECTEITDMDMIIDSWSTTVNRHLIGIKRCEGINCLGEGVVKLKWHGYLLIIVKERKLSVTTGIIFASLHIL